MAGKRFDLLTAGLLALGLLCLPAGLRREDSWHLLAAAGACLGLPGLLHPLRYLRPSWRPVRTRVFTIHLAYIALFAFPCALTADRPGRSLVAAVFVLILYFSFHAYREAFTAAEDGLLSPGGFLVIAAVGSVALVAVRGLEQLLGLGSGAWLGALAGDPSAPAREFDRMFDLLLVGVFPVLATQTGAAESRRARLLWWGCTGVAAVGILLAFGRSAWLALILELLLLLVLDPGARRRYLAVLTVGVLAALFLPGGAQRIASIVQAGHPTNSQRLEQWSGALELVVRSPLLGHGLGSFGELYQRLDGTFTGPRYLFPHNLLLHLAAECGLPALMLFLAWIYWLFTGWPVGAAVPGEVAMRRARALRLGAKIAAAGLLLFACFDL